MRRLSLALLFAAACDVGAVQPTTSTNYIPTDDLPPVTHGEFGPLAGYEDRAISGDAWMARRLDDTTEVVIAVQGLDPSLAYTAHVHVRSCAENAGGHYKIDPTIPTTEEPNELWIHGESTGWGTLFAGEVFDTLARSEARAVVVHDPNGGAKMACADLY